MPAWQVVDRIRNQEVKAEEYLEQVLRRIDEREENLHAYINVLKTQALKDARALDIRIQKGEKIGKLAGVALAVKDCICTEGVETTCGSRILKGFIPPYDATAVGCAKKEGAIIIGKTNMDEFAMGSSTEYSSYGPTRNPLNSEVVPGGSSGGSAAAVASGEATLSLGSDTGGSIRCPAAFCSVAGMKPTYGLVSRYGLVAHANSFDQIGPIARDVRDCALLLSVISGYDPKDSTSAQCVINFGQEEVGEKLKVGVPKEFFGEGTDDRVAQTVWRSLDKLAAEGAVVQETSLQSLKYSLSTYYIISMSEASSNLARFDGLRYGLSLGASSGDWDRVFSETRGSGFGPEVKRRIILGTFALSAGYFDAYYVKAQKIRTLMIRDFQESFSKYDVLVGPTMPILPFKLGERLENPIQMYMCDLDTAPVNLTGVPAISVPCGFCDGLPVGLQIIAPHFRDNLVIQTAYKVEQLV
jgi:aspartyl-tRNA(Asn)/glutamyl-tRNA(Gln) amidotransferase subunit A